MVKRDYFRVAIVRDYLLILHGRQKVGYHFLVLVVSLTTVSRVPNANTAL